MHLNSLYTCTPAWRCLYRGLGAAALLLALQSPALATTPTASATMTPTPTVTPCTTFPEPTLSVTLLQVQPAHPVVGDQVLLTFSAYATPGGIPSCSVFNFTPVLAGNPPAVTSSMFPVSAQFELTAAQAGTSMVRLSVNFETSTGCVEQPIYQFVTLSSDPFPVEVAPLPTASPTPTAVQSSRDEGGSCSLRPAARADYTALLLAFPVAWLLRRRRKGGELQHPRAAAQRRGRGVAPR